MWPINILPAYDVKMYAEKAVLTETETVSLSLFWVSRLSILKNCSKFLGLHDDKLVYIEFFGNI